MKYEWDEAKRAVNVAKHGLDFAQVTAFEWQDALILPDMRRDYGEPRYYALGKLAGRLHVLVFTPRDDSVRVIGLRKANAREVALYDSQT